MAQFLMQGHGFPGADTQYHPMMPNYSMPNYPYIPTYPPPHGPHPFPFPQQYVSPQAQAYGRKHQYNWNEPVSPISNPVVDDAEAIPISYPLVSDWLQRMRYMVVTILIILHLLRNLQTMEYFALMTWPAFCKLISVIWLV